MSSRRPTSAHPARKGRDEGSRAELRSAGSMRRIPLSASARPSSALGMLPLREKDVVRPSSSLGLRGEWQSDSDAALTDVLAQSSSIRGSAARAARILGARERPESAPGFKDAHDWSPTVAARPFSALAKYSSMETFASDTHKFAMDPKTEQAIWKIEEEARNTVTVDEFVRQNSEYSIESDSDADDADIKKKVREITDLRPHEMARLESRFTRRIGDSVGLQQEEFESVMKEFTGMEVELGAQLFCKIDANDDGCIEWDEFLSYIVHEAGTKLEAAKWKPECSMSTGVMYPDIAQPKDMVGAAVVCTRHRLIVTIGMVKRDLIFWNLESHEKVYSTLVPSMTEIEAPTAVSQTKAVASRSLAYLQTSRGAVFVSSGTENLILEYDCRKFRVVNKIFPQSVPSCMSITRIPHALQANSNMENAFWLLVGDINGEVAAYNCKTFQVAGRYKAHDWFLEEQTGLNVNAIILWPKVGIISCGDDGRVVVGDYDFWKVKDYKSDEKLKVLEIVQNLVNDARDKEQQYQKAADQHQELHHKITYFQDSDARRKRNNSSASKENLNSLKDELSNLEKELAFRKDLSHTRNKLLIEFLLGVASLPIKKLDKSSSLLNVESDMPDTQKSFKLNSDASKGKGLTRQASSSVLQEVPELTECFEGCSFMSNGVLSVKHTSYKEPMEWKNVCQRLDTLKGKLTKEAEKGRKTLSLHTTHPQTCISFSEKYRCVVCGGKDKVIRLWNPFIVLEGIGVEELKGHSSRIVGLYMLDHMSSLVSVSADKTVRVWEMHSLQTAQKFLDTFQHRPIDRFSCSCFDQQTKELITFGNRAKFWKIESNANAEAQSSASLTKSAVQSAIRSRSGKTEKTRSKSSTEYQLHNDEFMKESGWTVVDVSKVVDELQQEYKRGELKYLPSLDILSSKATVREDAEDQRKQDKLWVSLQTQLDYARSKGTGEQTVAACYSVVFHQIIVVGVHHVRTFCMKTGNQLNTFRVSQPSPITSACLDYSQRRLFTGAHDGSVRSWNFNSGVMLKEYTRMKKEIAALVYLSPNRFIQRPLVGAGWDQVIVMYPDGKDDNAQSVKIQGHQADILCLCMIEKTSLEGVSSSISIASGDAAGNLIVWMASNGRMEQTFTPATFQSDMADPSGFITQSEQVDSNVGNIGHNENKVSIFSLLHIKGTSSVLVGIGSGHIHVIDVHSMRKVKTYAPEEFPDALDITREDLDETDINKLCLTSPDAISCMAVNSAKTKVVMGEASGAVQVWRLQSTTPFSMSRSKRMQGHWKTVVNIVFSPKSGLWVSVGGEGSCRLWDGKEKPLALIGSLENLEMFPRWLEEPGARRRSSFVQVADGETGKIDSPTSTAMTSSDGLRELSDQASVEEEPVPFHVRYPPYIAKSLSKASESSMTAFYKMNSFDEKRSKAAKENTEEFRDEKRERMTISRLLNDMHVEACLELSNAQREKISQLEDRLSSLYRGPPQFPRDIVLKDILPQGKYPNEVIQRLEDHCQVIELLNKHRMLIKDAFRTYASLSLNQVTTLDKISLSELKIFCKDNRCSQRVLVKVPHIMLTSLRPEQEIVSDEDDSRMSPTQNNHSQPSIALDSLNVKLGKFVECIVRISREQIPGKDNLPKKLQIFLTNMTKHCRIPSRDSQQMSSIPEIQKVFKKRSAQIRRVFLSYSQEDTEDLEDGKDETMNLKELYQFMKDSQQMDSKFGISKLASCFVTANSVVAGSSSGGDDGTWNDWDWELEYDEFLEVIVRIVDLKTKTAEGQLADKVDKFLSDCFAANTYN